MSLPLFREFKLGGREGDGRHPYVNQDGAFMGRGVPLLEKDEVGRWRARPRPTLEKLFRVGYGVPVDLGWRTTQLGYVAQALNKGDLCLASISLVRMELQPLPNSQNAREMAKADGLLIKSDPDWEDESRVPAGNPGGGQWTTSDDAGQLHLPPGDRIDELGDLLEWIANSRPEDKAAIRKEIKRLYYDVGDTRGGDAMNRALNDVFQNGGDRRDREAVLEDYESYTRADPAEVAQVSQALITGALLSPLGLLSEAATDASVWEMRPVARGVAVNKILGADPKLAPNTPVIDAFADGDAISIKSIDLNAETYQDTGRLAKRVDSYVDQLAAFDKLNWDEVEIWPEHITSRTLKIGIPENSITDTQLRAINIARARAEAMGVEIKIYPIP